MTGDSRIYNFFWDRWYKRAKKKARKNPEYAFEEDNRNLGHSSVMTGEGNDGTYYTMEDWKAHHDLFDKINPRPWWIKVHHWRDAKRLRFGMKYNDFRWFIQRGRRGYADCDLWSFDTYLADVISKGVIHLRDTTHGYPMDLSEDKWTEILTTISEGFSQDKFSHNGFDNEKFDKSMELFVKYFHNLWD